MRLFPMKASKWLWTTSLVALAIGLAVGFWPRSDGAYDCGTAFHPTTVKVGVDTLMNFTPCRSAHANAENVTWVVLGLAVALALVALMLGRRAKGSSDRDAALAHSG